MNTKPAVNPFLYLESGFLSGIICVTLTVFWLVVIDLILDPGHTSRMAFLLNPYLTLRLVWPAIVPAALLSAILGILLARKLAWEKPIPSAILLAGCSAGLVGSFAATICSFCFVITMLSV
jgi:hypothetical protein